MGSPVSVEQDGAVTVIRMTAGENRLNPTMVGALNDALDAVERVDGPAAVVLTGEGKFFSTGLDLEWMGAASPGEPEELLRSVHALYRRLLVFPTATVAALNGHAYAAAAMLAMTFDCRVMRDDRGFFCLPEADIGLPFTPEMNAVLKATLPTAVAREAMFTGRRYGGLEAVAAGIVDAALPEDELLAAAVERAAAQAGKSRETLAAIKRSFHADTLAVFEG
jgi:enoyl-CoA hydratase/carnithine racemase